MRTTLKQSEIPGKRFLEDIKTCDLVEELKRREGVETHWAGPDKDFMLKISGPAVVLVVID